MNIGQMMKQVQDMQTRMAEMQSQLDTVEVTGQSGGGMVVVTLNGKAEMRRIKIDPKLIVPEDAEVLEDLIVAAFNDAKQKAEQHIASETERLMGGLKLPPGVKLPI